LSSRLISTRTRLESDLRETGFFVLSASELSGAVTGGGQKTLDTAPFENQAEFNLFIPETAQAGAVITIQAAALDPAGNTGQAEVQVTVADVVRPAVAGVVPEDGAVGVPRGASITLSFSEPILPATVDSETFRVAAQGSPAAGTITFSDGNAVLIWQPDGDLTYGAVYEVILTDGISDPAGNGLVPFTSAFTVAEFTEQALSVYVLSGGDSDYDQQIEDTLIACGHNVLPGVSSVSWNGTQADLANFDVVILQNSANWAAGDMPPTRGRLRERVDARRLRARRPGSRGRGRGRARALRCTPRRPARSERRGAPPRRDG